MNEVLEVIEAITADATNELQSALKKQDIVLKTPWEDDCGSCKGTSANSQVNVW